MEISRQHDDTDIHELKGQVCQELVAVGETAESGVTSIYCRVADSWFRLFVDEGVLFWSEGEPDGEDDLDESEQYIDLLARMNANGRTFDEVSFRQGELILLFEGGSSIRITEDRESGAMMIR